MQLHLLARSPISPEFDASVDRLQALANQSSLTRDSEMKEWQPGLDDVVGQTAAVGNASRLVSYLKDPATFARKGLTEIRKVVISGPGGTGKTLLAEAIRNESGVPSVGLEWNKILQMPNAQQTIGAIMEALRKSISGKVSRGILYLDGVNGNPLAPNLISTPDFVFDLIGNCGNREQITLMVSSTLEESENSGKSRQIKLKMPDADEIVEVLAYHFEKARKSANRDLLLFGDVYLPEISKMLVGYSQAQVAALVQMAIEISAQQSKGGLVTKADILSAVETFKKENGSPKPKMIGFAW